MMFTKQERLENYDSFLTEMKLYCLAGKSFGVAELSKVHNVDTSCSMFLKQKGYLLKISNKRYTFDDKGKLTEDIVDEVLKYLRNKRIENKKNIVEKSEFKTLKVTRKPLQPLIDSVINITRIGRKYGVNDDDMNSFVSEILKVDAL